MDKLNGRKKIVFSRYMAQYKSHIKHIMELPDSPRKIAAGMAVGIIFEFLPIPIISVPLTFLLSKCIRANAVAAVITGIICKIAVPFFFTLNYMMGRLILGSKVKSIHLAAGFPGLSLMGWLHWIQQLGYPFLVGSLINAALAGSLMYGSMYQIFLIRQKRKSKTNASHHACQDNDQ